MDKITVLNKDICYCAEELKDAEDLKFPRITMELYETDISALQEFIANEKAEEFTEEYWILYNFATDCKYSEHIQPELIRYLLPFYYKTIEQVVTYGYGDKNAVDIYYEFNKAIFFNQKNFIYAVGEKNYQYLMEYYIEQTIYCMEMENSGMLDWVSLFNTTVAFCNDNIRLLFKRIFKGSLNIKYAFFQYLSVLLFKESDNLLAVNESGAFWTSTIWYFDDGYFTRNFFWNDDVVNFFDQKINRERIETLFTEVKPFICDILGSEVSVLFQDEMNQSFATGIFYSRKAEFLKKINSVSKEETYWDKTF